MNAKIKRMLAIGIGLLMGGWLVFYGAREFVNSKRLSARGISAQAEVVDLRERVTSRLRTHTYYLTIAFEAAGGRAVKKEVKVTRATFTAAQVGGTVKAYYLAEDPSICAAGQTVDLRYGNALFGLLLLGAVVFLWTTMNQRSGMEVLAEKIEAQLRPMMADKYDYAPVRLDEFAHLDLGFYDAAQRRLEESGYRFLADEENVSVRINVGERTFLRVLVSREQTVVGFLYHFKVRNAVAKDAKVMDLESWFSNGHFVCTSNAARAGVFDSPPRIHSTHLAAEATWDEVIDAHQKQVTDFLANNPGVDPIKLNNLEEVRRFQNELQRTKAEHRRTIGLSKAELERFVRGRAGIDVDELHAKLAERLRKQNFAPAAA